MMLGRRALFRHLPLVGGLSAVQPSAPAAPWAAALHAPALKARLLAALSDVWIVDSHEHIWDEQERLARPVDFFLLLYNYTSYDLESAGLSTADSARLLLNRSLTDAERWRAIEPYWRAARNTGFAQALRIAVRDLYGIDEISASTIRAINDAIAASSKPGLYRHILKDRARIKLYVLNDRKEKPTEADPEYFVVAREFDQFVVPGSRDDIQTLERSTGLSITSLRDLTRALDASFRQAVDAGIAAVKTLLAYQRTISMQEVDEAAAARDFTHMMRRRTSSTDFRRFVERPFRRMEDYLFHHLMRLVEAHRLPVQVHTGYNNGHFIDNANPTLLTNLFFRYPTITFDLFHIGYPFQAQAQTLTKAFPNVHLDFCWVYILSPVMATQALLESLDMVPANKIIGFGGDYWFPELTYAHATMARQVIADVLTLRIERGACSEDEALQLGRLLLNDNAARLFAPSRRSQ